MLGLLQGPYRTLRRTAGDLLFERRYGVQTGGRVLLEDFGLASDERVYYSAERWGTVRRAFRAIGVGEQDVFIDLGSGMGRMVLEAARFPLKRVVGVELAATLHAIAQENVRRSRMRRRCLDISLVCSDVLAYKLPDDATIIFMNNPFRGSVFSAMTANLIASLDRHPRSLHVIYTNPVDEHLLLATERFRLVSQLSPRRRHDNSPFGTIRIYEACAAGEGEAHGSQ